MLRKAAIPFLILAMFTIAGGHWATLQSVAWVQMVITYSAEQGSVINGLQMTFSGEKPCLLCKVVKAGKEAEQDLPVAQFNLTKIETICVEFTNHAFLRPWLAWNYPLSPTLFPDGVALSPPDPVPISAAV